MGEVCNAGSRIYVERAIYADFVDQFIAEGKAHIHLVIHWIQKQTWVH